MLKWEQLTLTQQLNCVCDTLVKRLVTTAINHGYHDRPTQLLPKEDGFLSYGAIKSQEISLRTYVFMQARKWHEGI